MKMYESMLEMVLFLRGIGKVQETEGGVITTQFWPMDATSSQHRNRFVLNCLHFLICR
jgi:hypothetical protein